VCSSSAKQQQDPASAVREMRMAHPSQATHNRQGTLLGSTVCNR
jgi:hypothetical protein